MPCDVQELESEACESGLACVTNETQLLIILAQLLCEIEEAQG